MRVLFLKSLPKSRNTDYPPRPINKKNPKPPYLRKAILFSIAIVFLVGGIINKLSLKEFIIIDDEGHPQLAQWRKDKLKKELDDLDWAEQYVLITRTEGIYPCFSCPNEIKIHLQAGMVWKYGTTTKGEKGRYPRELTAWNVQYVIQFEGVLHKCLKEEKRKIYHYPLLPENFSRPVPLIRPPGNKKDS